MQSSSIAPRLLAAATALLAVGSAQSAITVYTSQATFAAAVGSFGTDTFAGFDVTDSTPSPITRTVGSLGYTATTSDLSTTGSTGFFGAGTSADPYLSTTNAIDTIFFGAFTGGVATAIGANFFGSNIGGSYEPGSVTVVVTEAGGATSTRVVSASGAATGSFLGFTSTTAISGLSMTAVQPASGSLWPTVDNFMLAAAVPEPGTLMLALGGLAAVTAAGRRRRNGSL